jgi:hypothetical protein
MASTKEDPGGTRKYQLYYKRSNLSNLPSLLLAQSVAPKTEGSGATTGLPAIQPKPQSSGLQEEQLDLVHWTVAQHSNDPTFVERYLERFPKGAFANLARERLVELSRSMPQRILKTPEVTPLNAAEVKEVAERQIELIYWSRIYYSGNPEFFHEYLLRYPKGLFTEVAKQRLAEWSD